MSEKNTSNQQDTTKQNEKYDVVYNKNSGYSQSEVTKLIKIYHIYGKYPLKCTIVFTFVHGCDKLLVTNCTTNV